MRKRLIKCDLPGFPKGVGSLDIDMALWHCGHVTHIRKFVAAHPTHSLIELDLYDTTRSSNVMATLFEANTSCWGHSNEQHLKLQHTTTKLANNGRRLYVWP